MESAGELESKPCPECHLPLFGAQERHWMTVEEWVLAPHRCTASTPIIVGGQYYDITATKSWRRKHGT